jgi:hypothetical protein
MTTQQQQNAAAAGGQHKLFGAYQVACRVACKSSGSSSQNHGANDKTNEARQDDVAVHTEGRLVQVLASAGNMS